ncbi:MAG TPA: ABC transporter permease [Ignavibacteria bacterium]|nr:ABC transporter permease [Ignavibacteria bacterium]
MSLSLIDPLISALMIVFLPIFLFLKRNKISILSSRLNFTAVVLIILTIFFIFAPFVADSNPDFQKNLSVTRLLPPLSVVKVIHLKDKGKTTLNDIGKFITQKKLVVKNIFNESIIFADSVHVDLGVIYFQKGFSTKISNKKLQFKNGKPYITSRMFILGTDELGRDIYSRLVYGARVSLFVGLGSVVISLLLGLSLGFLAGYIGGIIDTIISRFTDMFMAFPIIFLIILILAFFGNSLLSIIIVLGFSGWMSLFKIVRGEVISLKTKDFFISAKLIGLPKRNLLLKEILPLILAPVIVNLVFQYGNVILAEAALSFLGLGTGNLYPSWGAMIAAGQNYLSQAWWMIFFPGITLFFTLYVANNLGKEINVKLNPRLNE